MPAPEKSDNRIGFGLAAIEPVLLRRIKRLSFGLMTDILWSGNQGENPRDGSLKEPLVKSGRSGTVRVRLHMGYLRLPSLDIRYGPGEDGLLRG